ncbi:hypothetical protein J6590_094397 [Homalodisca vitripennis]|nr:hypothetical protein J6590_094397 [Homalodisca vitripennis]
MERGWLMGTVSTRMCHCIPTLGLISLALMSGRSSGSKYLNGNKVTWSALASELTEIIPRTSVQLCV